MYLFFVILFTNNLDAQEQKDGTSEKLAKQLANPMADLISVPFQNNYEFNVGPLNGLRYTLNVQPIVPVSIGEKWNMISRTILPITFQKDVSFDGYSEFGIGDIVQSLFFSPKKPTNNGFVWGVGPVFLIPTATDDALGIKKWATGPNAVFLKTHGQWTYGVLVNHMWSFAGSGSGDVNTSFLQPYTTYVTPKGVSYTIASENTQDWDNDLFGGFIGVYYAQIISIKKYKLQVGGGPKVYYGNNSFNPDWGFRINVISLFPK